MTYLVELGLCAIVYLITMVYVYKIYHKDKVRNIGISVSHVIGILGLICLIWFIIIEIGSPVVSYLDLIGGTLLVISDLLYLNFAYRDSDYYNPKTKGKFKKHGKKNRFKQIEQNEDDKLEEVK